MNRAECMEKDHFELESTGLEEEKRTGSTEEYRELTADGWKFCTAAGLLEEAAVLGIFRIELHLALWPVLAFLWLLFVILTAAALVAASWLAERVSERFSGTERLCPLAFWRALQPQILPECEARNGSFGIF